MFLSKIIATVLPLLDNNFGSCYHSLGGIIPLLAKNMAKVYLSVLLFHYGDVLELNFAPFFCVYIKREVINNSLGLDAELGRHYRSDRIFCNYIKFTFHATSKISASSFKSTTISP